VSQNQFIFIFFCFYRTTPIRSLSKS